MDNKYRKSLYLLLFLLLTLFLLYGINNKIIEERIHYDIKINKNLIEYLYIFSLAIISGLLLFFGFKNFSYVFNNYLQNQYLSNVLTSTIIVSFSFIYSAYFHEITENLLDIKININKWKNILGYFSGRICIIIIIFLILQCINK